MQFLLWLGCQKVTDLWYIFVPWKLNTIYEMKSYRYLVNSRMPRHSCCEVRIMQLHDILLLRTSASLHSVSVGAKPLSTGQCAPCRRLYQLGDWLPPLIPACFSPPIEVGVISQLIFMNLQNICTITDNIILLFYFKNASAFLLRGAHHAIA